jgi:acyl carrier protein
MNEIITKINQQIANTFGVDVTEIQPDFDLRQDLNATELELADFMAGLEHEFHVEILSEEVRPLVTVSDLYELLLDKLNELG